jgi:hypothetical protein
MLVLTLLLSVLVVAVVGTGVVEEALVVLLSLEIYQ